jgi:uncharacterized RDD family membrane protein YckC
MSDSSGLLSSDDLVTGEAVALDLPPATVALRIGSGLIDVLVELALVAAATLVAFTAVATSDDALLAVVTILTVVGVFIALPTALETLTRGRTLGKLVFGLRTVRDDAGPISFRQAFIRALVGFVEVFVLYGVPALTCSLVSSRGKRVGDLLAGTYVVRDRFRFPGVRPAYMPPELAGWAATADIAPLPDGLALAVRQFLGRVSTLNPVSRAMIGQQLCTQALEHVAPAPPVGHHPETVLAAVLAERRRRDEARLAREDALRQRLRGQTRR